MSQGRLKRGVVVRPAEGPSKSRTGGRQRLKAELREQAGAAEVPWIGNNEAPGLVKLAKDSGAIGNRAEQSVRRGVVKIDHDLVAPERKPELPDAPNEPRAAAT